MQVMKRISRFLTANINSLLDQAEDPEKMVKQLIRDMEESIAEVRREAVRAVARQKQLEKQIDTATSTSNDLEDKARLALSKNNEELARDAVRKKLQTMRTRQTLEKELGGARDLAARLKSNLAELEDQVQVARRKRDELIRRKQAASAQLRTQEAARRSAESLRHAASSVASIAGNGETLDSYESDVVELEAQAEAEREVLDSQIEKALDLQKMAEDDAVEQELRRLKGAKS
jgi:phage shock protein A